MKTQKMIRMIVPGLAALFALGAQAGTADDTLDWQRQGYVTEVVVATATRAEVEAAAGMEAGSVATATAVLAWQEPGYVTETVIVTASRDEYFEAIRRHVRKAAGEAGMMTRPSLVLGVPNR